MSDQPSRHPGVDPLEVIKWGLKTPWSEELYEDQAVTYRRLGELHSRTRCALCNTPSSQRPMYKTLLMTTRAEALVCEDSIKCLRSRKRAALNV